MGLDWSRIHLISSIRQAHTVELSSEPLSVCSLTAEFTAELNRTKLPAPFVVVHEVVRDGVIQSCMKGCFTAAPPLVPL